MKPPFLIRALWLFFLHFFLLMRLWLSANNLCGVLLCIQGGLLDLFSGQGNLLLSRAVQLQQAQHLCVRVPARLPVLTRRSMPAQSAHAPSAWFRVCAQILGCRRTFFSLFCQNWKTCWNTNTEMLC